MGIRVSTLWRVPVYCAAAGWVSFSLTASLGRLFYLVRTVRPGGVTEVYADSLRFTLFSWVLLLLTVLVGGLWALRSMTRAEIAVSAAILAALSLALTLARLYLPDFSVSFLAHLYVQGWDAPLASLPVRLTGRSEAALLSAALPPFLFVPFGRKSD